MKIKGKFESKRGEDHLVSHFGELIKVEKEGEEEEEEEEEEEGEESQRKVWKFRFLYRKIMDFSMECLEFVYGTLDGCLCFCMGKSNHKPIFDEFGSKRTILSILVVFWIWVG